MGPMHKYCLTQSQLEAVCLGAISNRVFPVQAVIVAPSNYQNPNGSWELFSMDPLPTVAQIDEIIEVSRDLQAVFQLKKEA
jgi:hypothetical protein